MFNSSLNKITEFRRRFLEPENSTHRQYEALRAYFVEQLPGPEIAKRFGYTQGSLRGLIHQFRTHPHRPFFLPPAKGPQKAPKKENLRGKVIALRKQNLSIYDISQLLSQESRPLSPVSVSTILKEEGFARLPRRRDEERPPGPRPIVAEVADCRKLDLSPRHVRTKFGGLFLFLPFLCSMPFDQLIEQIHLPGSTMIPAPHAIRSLLALKLFGAARHSHVMSYVLDEGLALFAGLNVIPKRAFFAAYSCRINPACYARWMQRWFDAADRLKLDRGDSFDLDFHTIPFHGEDALVEKHYVSKRSRRQKGVLAFLAQDATTRVFCYANAAIRKDKQNDEILRFIDFWQKRTGAPPTELIFDSKLTTYKNLNEINRREIAFITLRRRSNKMLAELEKEPLSAWRTIHLEGVSRIYRTPKILDRQISLKDYKVPIRQIVIANLGHEEPTFLLTNQLTRSAPKLIARYAQRMMIENNIEDGIDFFHMDALSSAVAMKVNCDLQLTLMASSLYRLLSTKIGNGYQNAKSRHLFRDFIDATAAIEITEAEIVVHYQKRAHDPLLIAAGFDRVNIPVPWLGGKRLQFVLA
jgi:hypothetical protein